MTFGPREARGVFLRLLVWLPALFWAAWAWGWNYADLFRPLYRMMLELAMGGFRFDPIQLIHTHEYLFKASYVIEQARVVGGHMLPPNLEGYVQAPIYYALIHPIVLAAAALVWPGLGWRGRAGRLLASLPALVLLETVDIPLVLYSSINNAVIQIYDPRGYLADKPIDWVYLLEGGGRYVLCIVAAFVAAETQRALSGWMARRAPVPA